MSTLKRGGMDCSKSTYLWTLIWFEQNHTKSDLKSELYTCLDRLHVLLLPTVYYRLQVWCKTTLYWCAKLSISAVFHVSLFQSNYIHLSHFKAFPRSMCLANIFYQIAKAPLSDPAVSNRMYAHIAGMEPASVSSFRPTGTMVHKCLESNRVMLSWRRNKENKHLQINLVNVFLPATSVIGLWTNQCISNCHNPNEFGYHCLTTMCHYVPGTYRFLHPCKQNWVAISKKVCHIEWAPNN